MKRSHPNILKDEKGSLSIIFTMTLVILIVLSGGMVDLMSSRLLQSKLQQSLDAAGLSAALLEQSSLDIAEKKATAKRYFILNSQNSTIESDLNPDNLSVNFLPNETAPTSVLLSIASKKQNYFLPLAGTDYQNVGARAEVNMGGSSVVDMDIIFVADSTGSMAGNKMNNMGQALWELTNRLLPANPDADYKVRLALVEWAWWRYPVNVLGNHIKRYTPFTSNRTTMMNIVTYLLAPGGATPGGIAAEYSRDKILAPPARPDGNVGAVKVWIFLTDGEFNAPTRTQAEMDFAAACTHLKSSGVIVYTIRYGNAGNKNLLRNCAGDNFYDVPNPADLPNIIVEITDSLGSIRLLK